MNIQEAYEKLYQALFDTLKAMPAEDQKIVIKEFSSAPPVDVDCLTKQ